MEIWKKLDGYDHDYEISSYGRVKNAKTNRILKQKLEVNKRSGYTVIRCGLIKNKKTTTKTIARLVLQTFNPIPDPENYHADHIDHNSSNNKLCNLRWLTQAENNLNKRKKKNFLKIIKEKDEEIANLKRIIEDLKLKL